MMSTLKEGRYYFGLPRAEIEAMLKSLREDEPFDVKYGRLRNFITLASGSSLSDPELLFQDLDAQLNSVGIFSMSDCPDNELMWAHYAGNHEGVCLGFSAAAGSVLADPLRCRPVEYRSEVPKVPEEGLTTQLQIKLGANGKPISRMLVAFSDPTFQAAITTKSLSWAYEREWRYIEPMGGEYTWPGPLTEITFGLRCPEPRQQNYRELADRFVEGELQFFQIQKVPNSNSLKRKYLYSIAGHGQGRASKADDRERRVASGQLVAGHVEELLLGGSFEDALDIVNSQLEKDPSYFPALFQKGIALGYMERHEAALDVFGKCCELFPEYADVWYQKGVALDQLGRRKEAIDAYVRAQALNPSHASTQFNLGSGLLMTGQLEAGLRHLEAAVRNGHPRARRALELWSARFSGKVGRNAPCPCGSGRKFKKCHGA